ncbi:MAG: 4-(cytidine 5'-diphospho)-2-C-methyl-D-erythritol kinase, partial [bacterium]
MLQKRTDGYHEIETVLQQISLDDIITIQANWENGNGNIKLTTDHPELPIDSSNLAFKAAEKFQENFPEALSVRILLQKRIPFGAGLGSGSSNAASVLLALNRLTGNHFTQEELERQAKQLGADVPFFIRGGMAHATGIGEKLASIDQKMRLYVVVVVPEVSISTKWAYTNLRIRLTNTKNNFNLA